MNDFIFTPGALNPYVISLTDPINLVYNEYTVDPFDDIVYSPPQMKNWDYFWHITVPRFWRSSPGHYFAIGLAAAAVVYAGIRYLKGCSMAIQLLAETAALESIFFFGAALIVGLGGAFDGHGFAKKFSDYITDNWAQTVAITAITYFATLAITAIANPTALCFKEGTLVETEDGLRPIEEIKEGDWVLAFDEQTGEQAFKPVVQLFRNTTDKWYHIKANGEEIICTAEHPFYVVDLGFVPAKNLSVTDKLLSSDNSVIEIDSITIETLSTPETTYNFEVADYHTYYVSESGVLVHNDCCPLSKEQAAEMSDKAALAHAKYYKINKMLRTAVSAVVDRLTGKTYFGFSGPLNESINVHPLLLEQMPSISLELWDITNCAEFRAVNTALWDGAEMGNLVVTTYRVRSLKLFPMCGNCQVSLRGVLFVVSG